MSLRRRVQFLVMMTCVCALSAPLASASSVRGSLKKWDTATIDFEGSSADAADNDPNPFLDYRLQIRFTGPSGAVYEVPGFFAGDGVDGLSGNVWRVLFSPDESGEWQFRASFRKGDKVAVSLDPSAGEPTAFDGTAGRFRVEPQDEEAPGFYRWGRLEYVGKHYLKFRDGTYWVKGGTDSPEDFLAYKGFSNTPQASHAYECHVADWREGDPDWGNAQGKGIIGALNYLASVAVNSIYFLPMNIGGDGKNVYPYLGPMDGKGSPDNDNLHFDLTKLRQWGIVFEHAQRNGIMLHFVLNEAEEPNKRELDDGKLGVERRLFYRELVARYGHLPALQWNISEEYNLRHDLGPDLVKAFAQYILDVDPYDHPVTVHHSSRADKVWSPFLGDSRFTVTSFQENKHVSDLVERWRARSRKAGVPLVIGMDEFFPDKTHPDNIDRHRKEYIWPIYFSGGQMEFILDELLKTEDFRKYEPLWHYMAYARKFMEEHLPFWEMEPADTLLVGASEYTGENNQVTGQVLAKKGACYAIYLPSAENAGILDLREAHGAFIMRWYNPRTGLFEGPESRLQGGRPIPLGLPPGHILEDWVALLKPEESS